MSKKSTKIQRLRLKRKYCIKRLWAKGITHVNGKNLGSVSNRDLYKKFEAEFNVDDFNKYYEFRTLKKNKIKELDKAKTTYVYFIGNLDYKFCKIGYSANPSVRLSEIQTGCPFEIEVIGVVEGGRKDELNYQQFFRSCQSWGEWFHIKEDLEKYINDKFLFKNNENKKRRVKLRSGDVGYIYSDSPKERGKSIVYLENDLSKIIYAYEHNLTFIDEN